MAIFTSKKELEQKRKKDEPTEKRFALVLYVNKNAKDKMNWNWELHCTLRDCDFSVEHCEASTLPTMELAISQFEQKLENYIKSEPSGICPLESTEKTIGACFVFIEIERNQNGELESEDGLVHSYRHIALPFRKFRKTLLKDVPLLMLSSSTGRQGEKVLNTEHIIPEHLADTSQLQFRGRLNFCQAVKHYGHLELSEMLKKTRIQSYWKWNTDGNKEIDPSETKKDRGREFFMKPNRATLKKKRAEWKASQPKTLKNSKWVSFVKKSNKVIIAIKSVFSKNYSPL